MPTPRGLRRIASLHPHAAGVAHPLAGCTMESLLQALQPEIVRPLLLAVVLGGLIGFEREIHGRPAGLRTHILVCLTSTLLILASKRIPEVLGDSETARIVFDPNRLAAGVMTGIGFLGAASVIRAGDSVRGITTGATVWAVAGLGVVIGQGEHALALVATLLAIVVLVGLNKLTSSISPVIYRRLIVRGQAGGLIEVSERVRKSLSTRSGSWTSPAAAARTASRSSSCSWSARATCWRRRA